MDPVAITPQLSLVADGVPLSAESVSALEGVRVQQRLSLPTLCELTFCDPLGSLQTALRLLPGITLRVSVDGGREPLFSGEVTAVEHVYGPSAEREIRVRGYDLLHRLRKRQSVRAHVQMTLRDLAQELVADLGLSVQAAEPGPLWQRLIQHRQSDLELLLEAADRCGLYLVLRDDVLHLLTLEGMGEPLSLTLGESLHEARFEVNGEPACRSVTATGWNPLRVESYQGRVSNARVGRAVAAKVSGRGGGR